MIKKIQQWTFGDIVKQNICFKQKMLFIWKFKEFDHMFYFRMKKYVI